MPRVTVIQVVYNNRQFMEPVFSAIVNQTYKDIEVVAVIAGNEDGGKELLMQKFPQVVIIDPGYNIGFAAGHNLVFSAKVGSASGGHQSEFFQLVNPDLILEKDYIEEMLKAFDDPKVGAATGKLYQADRSEIERGTLNKVSNHEEGAPPLSPQRILDTTGVNIYKSGRARDRGQHEVDNGQYDGQKNIQAVSGAGPMFRREALESIKSVRADKKYEYFDEDFHSYWEDVDLSWRMSNAGWNNIFVPSAVGFHGRGAASSKNGYSDVFGFIKHHKQISTKVKQLNYKNHILMYVKNSPKLYPQFFVREFFMFWYILIFEIGTLKVMPEMLKLLPKMWRKRKRQATGLN